MFETQFLDMEDRTPIISFRNADIINGEATVIYGLDMDVYPGDFVYIVGKVGTGKTSIIRTIIAENPLHKGKGEACGFELRDIRDKDSLDVVELIMNIEDEFGVSISDEEAANLFTVQRIVEFLEKLQ